MESKYSELDHDSDVDQTGKFLFIILKFLFVLFKMLH